MARGSASNLEYAQIIAKREWGVKKMLGRTVQAGGKRASGARAARGGERGRLKNRKKLAGKMLDNVLCAYV